VIRPRATIDVADIFEHLAVASPGAALRFYDAYSAALLRIRRMPEAGGRLLLSELEEQHFRYVFPKGFRRYLIFYQLTATNVEVVRVLHASRDLVTALRDV
jgi:toxin ParE1/3/4